MEPVDHTIAALDEFAECRPPKFGDDSAVFRKNGEAFDRVDDVGTHARGVVLAVSRDVVSDRLEVMNGLVGPVNAGPRAKRLATSSCGMSLPASASARPRSILLRK